jgi:hypothetical protein
VENPEESRLSEDLAVTLREVWARIRRLDVPDEVRSELARRMLAITTTAKRDLAIAARRLERLTADLDSVHGPSSRVRGAVISLRHKGDSHVR